MPHRSAEIVAPPLRRDESFYPSVRYHEIPSAESSGRYRAVEERHRSDRYKLLWAKWEKTESKERKLFGKTVKICYHFGNKKLEIRAGNHMEISFRNRKLAKVFSSEKTLRREYGDRAARIIMIRLAVLLDAETLAEVPATPPDRMHQLTGDRNEQFAVYLVHPYRLVFEPAHDSLPRKEDGGIDLEQVTAITVIEVVDYH